MNIKYLAIVIIFITIVRFAAGKAVAPEIPSTGEGQMPPGEVVAENPDGEADPNRMKLDMKTWNWISAQYNDGTKITVKNPERFALTFKNDGTFSASTDCNGIGGNYTVDADRRITFSNMMSTLMFCTDSQETEFRQVLENANTYFFTGKGELIIEQKFDSGTATFR